MKLLQHFKELTIHPKNAKELKGLILQLAIQGKLTKKWREENINVESALILLSKIEKEKAQLIKEKRIAKEKPTPEILEKDIPYELPEGWIWSRFSQNGFTQTGATPPKNKSEYFGDHIPFIGPGNISNTKIDYPSEGLSKKGLEAKGRLISKNSLMMVCIGGSIGKCYVNEIDVSCNQQINTITPIISGGTYLKIVCQSPYFQKAVIEKASGSATPIINKGKWENLLFPTAPLEEQKAIVESVNQLFAEVEQLEEQTKARIHLKEDFVTSALQDLATKNTTETWGFLQPHFQNFFTEKSAVKKLRETVLQLAVQGKLTQKWRADNSNVESASVLLEKIKAEKEQLIKDKKIKKEKPLPAITEEEIPYELPEGWEWCRLGEIGRINPRNYSNDQADVGFIPMKNISQLYGVLPEYEIRKWGSVKKSFTHFKNGDIAFAKITPCFENSKACVFSNLPHGIGAGTTELHVFRSIIQELVNEYIYIVFKTPNFLTSGERKMTGSAGQKRVPKDFFTNYITALPPIEEQKAIVEKVNSLMALCDQLDQEIEHNTKQVEQLMQSCLKEVFEG